MPTGNLSLIPGDVSINVFEALKKAMANLHRPPKPVQIKGRYVDQLKKGLNEITPNLKRAINALPFPLRRAYYRRLLARETPKSKRKRVKRELLDAGATLYGILKSESRYLPKILHDNEHIEAVIYGQHGASSAMLVATDERILFLDKKPMVELSDEVSYEVVSGVKFDIHMIFATVILHTPVKNYDFRFVNLRCAEKFTRHIETLRLEREQAEKEEPIVDILPPALKAPSTIEYPNELKEDMAGYYWLSHEEIERIKKGSI